MAKWSSRKIMQNYMKFIAQHQLKEVGSGLITKVILSQVIRLGTYGYANPIGRLNCRQLSGRQNPHYPWAGGHLDMPKSNRNLVWRLRASLLEHLKIDQKAVKDVVVHCGWVAMSAATASSQWWCYKGCASWVIWSRSQDADENFHQEVLHSITVKHPLTGKFDFCLRRNLVPLTQSTDLSARV